MLPSKTLFMAALVLAASAFASADTLQIGSFATSSAAIAGVSNTATTYGMTASTYKLANDHMWAAPLLHSSWISFDPNANTGGAYVAASGSYRYETTFTLAGNEERSGFVSVMADDVAGVTLNGHLLNASGGTKPGLSAVGTFLLPTEYLEAGANLLSFDVQQIHGGGTGLDFSGEVSVTPEPSSAVLLGTGLLSAAGVLLRRRVV
ncbi:MAG: hypothetical protein NVSMB3_11430 [Acidobacteriaceae bacterium]